MTDDQNPTDAGGTEESSRTNDANEMDETNEMTKPDQSNDDDRVRAQMKAALGAAVAEAPAPPTVDTIAARIGADAGSGRPAATGSAVPAAALLGAGDPRDGDLDLLDDYVAGGARPGARPNSRWARVGLVAAAVLGLLAIGAVLVNRGDRSQDAPLATAPGGTTEPAPGPTAPTAGAVAALPSMPPGQVLVGAYHELVDGQGEGTMLRYHLYSGRESLAITSTVVDPASSVPETGESGSIERWGDRDVTLDEDGRRAQFVDPAGLLVEVTGEPDDVAAVVPTLVIADAAAWDSFVAEMSSDIAALPVVAAYEVEAGGPEGLDFEGVDRIRISLHAHPESTPLAPVPPGGLATASGVVAGTCLTVDEVTTCRPGDPGPDVTAGAEVRTSVDVLVDGEWWQYGWSTGELTSVTHLTDGGGEVEAFWYFEGAGHGDEMTWFAARMPDDAHVLTTELGGSGGFQNLRPAS